MNVKDALDQILAHHVQECHRPCFACDGRGVVAGGPPEITWDESEMVQRFPAQKCPECNGNKRIEGKTDDLPVIASVYAEAVSLLLTFREQERFAESDQVLDWVNDYRGALVAKAAHDDPEMFKREVDKNLRLAQRLAAGESLIGPEDENDAPSKGAMTDDELRELGVLDPKETP